jgi:hypothetical protein
VIDTALQVYILTTACAALALITHPSPRARFIGCVIGLAGQPAWMITTWWAAQWGLLALSFVYAGLYLRGIWTHYGRL